MRIEMESNSPWSRSLNAPGHSSRVYETTNTFSSRGKNSNKSKNLSEELHLNPNGKKSHKCSSKLRSRTICTPHPAIHATRSKGISTHKHVAAQDNSENKQTQDGKRLPENFVNPFFKSLRHIAVPQPAQSSSCSSTSSSIVSEGDNTNDSTDQYRHRYIGDDCSYSHEDQRFHLKKRNRKLSRTQQPQPIVICARNPGSGPLRKNSKAFKTSSTCTNKTRDLTNLSETCLVHKANLIVHKTICDHTSGIQRKSVPPTSERKFDSKPTEDHLEGDISSKPICSILRNRTCHIDDSNCSTSSSDPDDTKACADKFQYSMCHSVQHFPASRTGDITNGIYVSESCDEGLCLIGKKMEDGNLRDEKLPFSGAEISTDSVNEARNVLKPVKKLNGSLSYKEQTCAPYLSTPALQTELSVEEASSHPEYPRLFLPSTKKTHKHELRKEVSFSLKNVREINSAQNLEKLLSSVESTDETLKSSSATQVFDYVTSTEDWKNHSCVDEDNLSPTPTRSLSPEEDNHKLYANEKCLAHLEKGSFLHGCQDNSLVIDPKSCSACSSPSSTNLSISDLLIEYQEKPRRRLAPLLLGLGRGKTAPKNVSRTLSHCVELVKLHFSDVENRLFEMFGNKQTKTINVKKFLAAAQYIPQLSNVNPDYWAVSICTVDGQRYSVGDVKQPFTIQSCSKPLTYAIACADNGPDMMHQYIGLEPSGSFPLTYGIAASDTSEEAIHHRIGMEPSGRAVDSLGLDPHNKPHNPMINSGAIMTAALVKPTYPAADRFDYVS
ncbi:Glutaminase [Trinorchestia longiramus]|nr:Glutaminase [Trinorchestia longiramus]